MMLFDCPAYLDQNSAARCGLPAEVRSRFTMPRVRLSFAGFRLT